MKNVLLDGKRIKLQIWDTAGQERFRTITNGARAPPPLLLPAPRRRRRALQCSPAHRPPRAFARAPPAAYYRGAMGILLVYDVTDRETFRSVRNWMSNIQMYASNDVNKVRAGGPPPPPACADARRTILTPRARARAPAAQILVGNKCDMDESKRRVQASEGEALAAEFGIPFFETSAMNNINVDTAFTHIAKCVKDRLSSSEDRKKSVTQSTLNMNSGASAQKKSCC